MNKEIEAQLWQLDRMYTRRKQDISTWTEFNIWQFAQAYAYYTLSEWINKNPGQIKKYIPLIRLANLTKKQLLEMLPGEKKSHKRIVLYKIARVNWEAKNG